MICRQCGEYHDNDGHCCRDDNADLLDTFFDGGMLRDPVQAMGHRPGGDGSERPG